MEFPVWILDALSDWHEKEIPGKKHNQTIVDYFKYTSYRTSKDETPWCAAFVSAMLERAGVKSTKSARARSYEKWGIPLDEPRVGCVTVFWRGSPTASTGHVGFFIKETNRYVWVLGGNQSNKVTISAYKKSQLIGYRWPEY